MTGSLIKILSLKKPIDNEYIKAFYWVKKGSLLDRRGIEVDRRKLSNRRENDNDDFKINNRRKTEYLRRRVKDRRFQSLESIEANNTDNLSKVELLQKGHYLLIELIQRFKQTLASGKSVELDNHLRDFSNIIRAYIHREDLILDAYLDANKNLLNEEINEMLMVLNLYIYRTGEGILENISKYKKVEVDNLVLAALVLDLGKIDQILTISFKYKKELLYPRYQQIADF